MVMQPTYGNGFIESPPIEITQEGLRNVLTQIEAELLDSEVYRRTMAGLQTMLGEGFGTAQILVKAVGREAVRLTFQQFVRQYKIVPVTKDGTNKAGQEETNPPPMVNEQPVQAESQPHATSIEEATPSVEKAKSPGFISRTFGETKSAKKTSKAELAAQAIAQQREEFLRQVGQELRQARQARSLSVQQLHTQTLVPLHHIESLETGRIDQLPEDVYVRGFIRRIGCALGLNGVAIADSIPQPDPVKSVVPSWYESPAIPGVQLNSVHLYLGYTALIAGAVGGLGLMSKQAISGTSVEVEPATPSQASVSPKADRAEATSKPGLKASKNGVKAGVDIAPPEASNY
ncbi:helix-turn-helix domain-containing protein [Microcoleus sp. FACHB-SPT15]|nr:helix-turn-helix domain-containing protein [Microcoleus sp. FACHB-SPT15]